MQYKNPSLMIYKVSKGWEIDKKKPSQPHRMIISKLEKSYGCQLHERGVITQSYKMACTLQF